jgi:hypothetical protein
MEIFHQVLMGVFFIKVKTKITVQGLIQRHTWTDMREQGILLPLAILFFQDHNNVSYIEVQVGVRPLYSYTKL